MTGVFNAFLTGLAELFAADQVSFDAVSFKTCMITVTDGISAECIEVVTLILPALLIRIANVFAAQIMAIFLKTLLIGSTNLIAAEFRNIMTLAFETFLVSPAFLITAVLFGLFDTDFIFANLCF